MSKSFILTCVLAVGAFFSPASAQGPAETSPCGALFDDVRARMETEYVGFADAIRPNPARLAAHHEVARTLRAEANATDIEGCAPVVQRYVAYFHDPHVFVSEMPVLTEEEAVAFRAHAPRSHINLARAIARAERRGRRNGLEGVWAAPDFDVVITPERDAYVAIVTASRSEKWAVGDVAARFLRNGDALRVTTFRTEDRAPIRGEAVLQREGALLHMPPATWGRIGAEGRAPFDARNPRAPTFVVLNDRATMITVPSFVPDYQPAIERILAEHGDDIRAHELLIIDVRGNEGGSPYLGYLLAPYFYSATLEPFEGSRPYPMALSSPRMIRYFGRMAESVSPGGYRDLLTRLVTQLEANPGALVPLYESPEAALAEMTPPIPEVLHTPPVHVAILQDRGSVSAAEAFVIEARRSPRVTIFGQPSGGSIDYQSVAVFRVGEGRQQLYLGLPTLVGSDQLREHGFNVGGVPPDITLQPGGDWIEDVLEHYR